jgi:hypothetical protein
MKRIHSNNGFFKCQYTPLSDLAADRVEVVGIQGMEMLAF